MDFSVILSVSSAYRFFRLNPYHRLTQLAMPNGAPELHQVLAGLPLQTNAEKQFCRPISVILLGAMVQFRLGRGLWVEGSPFHKGNRR